jgi:hypothetical protein
MKSEETEDSRSDELIKAPKLRNMSCDEFFKAPDGYYEKFSSDLSDRINNQKSNSWSVSGIFVKPVVVIPAVAILAAVIIWFSKPGADQKTYAATEMFYEAAVMDGLDESILCEYIEIESAEVSDEMEDVLLMEANEEILLNDL